MTTAERRVGASVTCVGIRVFSEMRGLSAAFFSFAPSELVNFALLFTHGLRRGLHSSASPRLELYCEHFIASFRGRAIVFRLWSFVETADGRDPAQGGLRATLPFLGRRCFVQ